jgi:hypothetical protein
MADAGARALADGGVDTNLSIYVDTSQFRLHATKLVVRGRRPTGWAPRRQVRSPVPQGRAGYRLVAATEPSFPGSPWCSPGRGRRPDKTDRTLCVTTVGEGTRDAHDSCVHGGVGGRRPPAGPTRVRSVAFTRMVSPAPTTWRRPGWPTLPDENRLSSSGAARSESAKGRRHIAIAPCHAWNATGVSRDPRTLEPAAGGRGSKGGICCATRHRWGFCRFCR